MTDRETLLRYRIKQAEETLADAEAMRKGALSTRSIINRAYYSIFMQQNAKAFSCRLRKAACVCGRKKSVRPSQF